MNIHEVEERTGLSADTLRYYEKIGLILPVRKIAGRRVYTEDVVHWIEFVKCLRKANLPIRCLVEYVRLLRVKGSAAQRLALLRAQLENLEAELRERTASLDYLRRKIAHVTQEVEAEKHAH